MITDVLSYVSRIAVLVAVVAAPASLHCGSKSPSQGSRALPEPWDGTPIAVDKYCEIYAQELCAELASCCPHAHIQISADHCLSVTLDSCRADVQRFSAASKIFHPDLAGRCLGQLNQGCQHEIRTEVCHDVWTGSAPLLGSCGEDADCALPTSGGANLCGGDLMCHHISADGEVCDTHTGGIDCESSLCIDGICQRARVGAPCNADFSCPTGARCDSTYKCVLTHAGVGEDCSQDSDCVSGYCSNQSGCLDISQSTWQACGRMYQILKFAFPDSGSQ